MWFNSRQNEKPHQGLTYYRLFSWKQEEIRKDGITGAAWLSSARAVRCSLKWGNERNPHSMLNIHWRQPPLSGLYLKILCRALIVEINKREIKIELRKRGRKEGKTSSQHGPYTLGYTHTTMAKNNELQAGNGKLISEISSQFRLGAETRPHEVGIDSNRESACRGEYVLGSCTKINCAFQPIFPEGENPFRCK